MTRKRGPGRSYRFGGDMRHTGPIVIHQSDHREARGGVVDDHSVSLNKCVDDDDCEDVVVRKRPEEPKESGWAKFAKGFTIAVFLLIFLGTGLAIGQIVGCEQCGIGDPEGDIVEGGACKRWSDGYCEEADTCRDAWRIADYYLNVGDAQAARGNVEDAITFWRAANAVGRSCGAGAARLASQRILYESLPCHPDPDALERIARNYQYNPYGGLVTMTHKKQALRALSLLPPEEAIDDMHTAGVRNAIAKFQNQIGATETKALSAEQTLTLVCAAATLTPDLPSKTLLGVMYATGMGVPQNTDMALTWLNEASDAGSADAAWNLALLYGTGTVHSSLAVCDAQENTQRADSYMQLAFDRGHPAASAVAANPAYDGDDPDQRWKRIAGDLDTPPAVQNTGVACQPNGSQVIMKAPRL